MLSIVLGVILGALIYYKFIKPASFWDEREIPHASSWPLVGSMGPFLFQKKHFFEISTDLYRKFSEYRYVGYMQFTTPALLLRDVELIKQIGVKEFDSFHEHIPATTPDTEPPFGKSLVNLVGDDWKRMRATLSPAFTTHKIKNMYTFFYECAENFTRHFQGTGHVDVEMKDIFSRFANDVIASTAFGIHVDSMKEPDNDFYSMGRELTSVKFSQAIKLFLNQAVPGVTRFVKLQSFPESIVNFFSNIIRNNLKKREEEKIVRPDMIHLLMEARKGKLKHDNIQDKKDGFATVEESDIGRTSTQIELTERHIISQCLLFFLAGFDTVSTASSYLAYGLAINPEIQKKLQAEIDSVMQQHDGKVSYEVLQSMKYLDQVICESLRLWPPVHQTDRLCNKNYTIVPTNSNEKTFVLEKGVVAIIPIRSIHYDPRYFPNPDKFDPERFSDDNKSMILLGSYLPFGIGPRNCIGSRFALVEMKTLFIHLLLKFDIVVTDKTPIPIKLDPKIPTVIPRGGIQLAFKARQNAF